MTDFVVFGKPDCSYCDRAKALLQMRGKTFSYADVRDPAALEALESHLPHWNRKVPQVFHNGAHIGGYTELQQYLGGQ